MFPVPWKEWGESELASVRERKKFEKDEDYYRFVGRVSLVQLFNRKQILAVSSEKNV